jgi:glutaredoxin
MFLLYYKQGCPYSESAETYFIYEKFEYIKIIVESTDFNLKNQFANINHRTFPVIFYLLDNYNDNYKSIIPTNGFIGGYSDMIKIQIFSKKLLGLNKQEMKNKIKEFIQDKNILYRDILKVIIFFLKNNK